MAYEGLCHRVGVRLTDYQVNVIRHHSSSGQDNLSLHIDCGEFSSLGRSVMGCAYAVYMYAEEGVRDKDELSKRLNVFVNHATNSIYERFSLEEFVIAGHSERPGTKHADIAQRLIAGIYINHGFPKAYEFLKPCFSNAPKVTDGEYKQLVQQYAQDLHIPFTYTVVGQSGPKSAPRYTCELRVGSERTQGTAVGKKRAETEAAKAFVRKHGLGIKKKRPSATRTVGRRGANVTEDRKHQLKRVAAELGVPSGCLTFDEMERALTHISYVETHPEAKSNDELRVVGARVLDMLANDYVYRDTEPGPVGTRQAVTALTTEKRIGRVAPQILMDSIRKGRNFNQRVAINAESIKADVVRAVIALLWLNYCTRGEERHADAAWKVALRVLEAEDDSPALSHTSLVQDIVQAHRYQWRYEPAGAGGTRHDPVYYEESIVTCDDWSVRSKGSGRTKKAARDDANKSLIELLLNRCPDDDVAKRVRMMSRPISDVLAKRKTPGRAFMTQEQLEAEALRSGHDGNSDQNSSVMEKNPTEGVPPKRENVVRNGAMPAGAELSGPVTRVGRPIESQVGKGTSPKTVLVNAVIESDVNGGASISGANDVAEVPPANKRAELLHVCARSYDCLDRGHTLDACRWSLVDLKGETVEVGAQYCANCDVTLMSYESFRVCVDERGPLLGKYTIIGRWRAGKPERSFAGFDPTPALYGYGVSEVFGLSDSHRALILSNAISNGAVSREETEQYLQFCVDMNTGREHMGQAVKKWRSDLKLLRDQTKHGKTDLNNCKETGR